MVAPSDGVDEVLDHLVGQSHAYRLGVSIHLRTQDTASHGHSAADGGYAAVVGPETAAWGDGPAVFVTHFPAFSRADLFAGHGRDRRVAEHHRLDARIGKEPLERDGRGVVHHEAVD